MFAFIGRDKQLRVTIFFFTPPIPLKARVFHFNENIRNCIFFSFAAVCNCEQIIFLIYIDSLNQYTTLFTSVKFSRSCSRLLFSHFVCIVNDLYIVSSSTINYRQFNLMLPTFIYTHCTWGELFFLIYLSCEDKYESLDFYNIQKIIRILIKVFFSIKIFENVFNDMLNLNLNSRLIY